MMNVDDTKTIELQKMKFALQYHISEELLLDTQIDIDKYLYDEITIRIRGFLWGETVKEEIICYPRDWWQSFKERWTPHWLRNKVKVIYTIHKININALYPELKISLPKDKHILRIEKYTHDEGW